MLAKCISCGKQQETEKEKCLYNPKEDQQYFLCDECAKEKSQKTTLESAPLEDVNKIHAMCIHCKKETNVDKSLCGFDPIGNEWLFYCEECRRSDKDSIREHTENSIREMQNHKGPGYTAPRNIPKCPTCGSTDIRKIDGLERGASVLTLGLFSKKINKSFKCRHCGYTW